MKYTFQPTDIERSFDEGEIIVSKTDLKGRITYANDVFRRVASYTEADLLGEPHSLVRHPDMPRCVFKLLWDTLQAGNEIFAYVKNMAKGGDFYWVYAHVTPSFDAKGNIVGFHSSRRVPNAEAIKKIEPIYAKLLAEEERHENRKEGMLSAFNVLVAMLGDAGVDYDEFVFSL